MSKNLSFLAKLGVGLAAVGCIATAASAYAMTPTFSISSTGGNSVEITVQGDANSNVMFYYNVASGSGMQVQTLGTTNSSGYFSTTVNASSYGAIVGDNTYVIVDGQQSAMQTWPTPTGTPSLNQTSVTIGLGQSVSVYSEGSSAGIYVSSNSDPNVASAVVNGTQITITGNETGSATISVCYTGTASDCATLYATVQTGSVVTFSQSNPTIATGQGISVTLSGGNGNYSITGNSNPSDVSAILSGNTITLTGEALGTANVTACDTSGNCGTLYVTVSSSASSGSLYFSTSNPSIGVGQTTTVTISNGSNYYVTGNSDTSVVSQSISGDVLTLSGLESGASTITVCSASNGCGSVTVTVGASNTNQVVFGITNPTVTVGQSMTISLSGGSGYYISSNSNPNVIQPSINGTSIVLYGEGAGSASIVVCASGGECSTLYVTVVAETTSTASSGSTTQASLLAAIQSMQNQLAQLVTQIQSMTTTLTQLAESAGVSTTAPSTTTTTTTNSYDFTEFLGVGSQNAQVTELQEYLTQKGFYTGPITGYFGTLTENAVAAYQSAHGISSVGYVGPSTRAALNAGE